MFVQVWGKYSMRLRAEGTLANKRAALRSLEALRNLVICVENNFSWTPAMMLLSISQLHSPTLPFLCLHAQRYCESVKTCDIVYVALGIGIWCVLNLD